MRLTSLQLSEASPLIGKSVAQSELSTRYSSLLVSVMRNEQYITPCSSTTFLAHDVLWLVGDPDALSELK